jgi:hypothetical protein
MLQRPDEAHSIWHLWSGPSRAFDCWYVNIQEPFRRTSIGYDTQDLELDLVVAPDGSWKYKDDELLELRIREGRFTAERVAAIRAEGKRIADQLRGGIRWWDPKWAHWVPPREWSAPPLPQGWSEVPSPAHQASSTDDSRF